ncbi:MAG: hypothetical protein CVU20_06330 [Betaproteobacteria bacterium HGW-Betaproteobacteria-14]|nr:MAG: hypothetical protein CVU20_06330 [Betaproteobacteria bacterium HGW-Betaproteobacteria-14]
MLIALTEFPVHPVKLRQESMAGYLRRCYWENGHEVPVDLREALSRLYRGSDLETAFTCIANVLPVWITDDQDWWVTHRLDYFPQRRKKPKWLHFHYPGFRYCPFCLKEEGIHRELWTLPLVVACDRHQCALSTQCHSCGRGLTWGTIEAGWRCVCGAELADAPPLLVAASWAVRLAALLEQALSPAAGLAKSDACSQIYGFLTWAQDLRFELKTRRAFVYGPRYFVQANARTRLSPDSWEESLFMGKFAIGERRLQSLVRWHFRGELGTLLLLEDRGPLTQAINALCQLPKNGYTTRLFEASHALLDRLRASALLCRGVFFHPRLNIQDQQNRLVAFANWWYLLARRISTLESNNRLTFNSDIIGGYSPELVIQILNKLFDAAFLDEDVDRYSLLIARWHVPKALQRKFEPHQVLDEVMNYLAGLSRSELCFVLDLICQGEGERISTC